MTTVRKDELRNSIIRALRRQGYRVRNGRISLPEIREKEDLRRLHAMAVAKKLAAAEPELRRYEDRLIGRIANGSEVEPKAIAPRLVQVRRGSQEELLFRYACLHWSIPVSSGYGRRLRFLVIDQCNDKLIGLFGLGDPVFSVRARDDYIGWSSEVRRKNLYHVMDAYVMGAVPPYASLLGGKLVALLTLANEIRDAFREKYADQRALISRKRRKPYLAMIATTSALGRSSVYNRIRANGFEFWTSVGFTQGYGEFHFSNGVYADVRKFVVDQCTPTAKHSMWGTGFRNKREVVRKCLPALGLSTDLAFHGVRREVFVAALGRDALRFLRGEVTRPCFHDLPAAALAAIWRDRWLAGRVERVPEYKTFTRETYKLWR